MAVLITYILTLHPVLKGWFYQRCYVAVVSDLVIPHVPVSQIFVLCQSWTCVLWLIFNIPLKDAFFSESLPWACIWSVFVIYATDVSHFASASLGEGVANFGNMSMVCWFTPIAVKKKKNQYLHSAAVFSWSVCVKRVQTHLFGCLSFLPAVFKILII